MADDPMDKSTDRSIGSSTDKSNFVLQESLQHPLTMYPAAVGLLGTLTTVLFGATPITAGVALGGLAIGAGSWCVNYYFRKDTFLHDHLLQLQRDSEARMKAVTLGLEKSLKNTPLPPDAQDYSKQALQQFALIRESYDNFRMILTDKLDPKEITFNRFLMTADQVNLAVLDNLQNIATRLKSISAINPDYIEERLAGLKKLRKTERADEDEMRTILARQQLREEQMTRTNELLTYNEEALTQLAKANAAVVDMHGKGGQTSMDLASATAELEEIAKRAKNF